ncbi:MULTISPECIES: restriction endonuclease subunit S [unclassified Allomuricauda]|uniref:restriction endonuclease subunit S n=1 Tax=unclassified Allomuricauda TaxID=2615049 RepID=UPI00273F0946|nr:MULTISPECIES: restriction endonuclease subunit S [unclassified Allomuricauda]
MAEVNLTPELRFPEFEGVWNKVFLKDVAIFLDGQRVPLSQTERAKKQGAYPYYGASGIIDYVDDYLFDEELVLLGEDGANILTRSTPLAFVVTGKIWVNNHAHVLRAKYSTPFLAESLERIRYDKYNTGTAQPKLNSEICKSISLYFTEPEEQQKIAAFLTAVDQRIQLLQQKKAKLEEYKKGVMQQIFSQQIRFKIENEDGELVEPPDWEEKRLGEIGEIITGKTPTTSDKELWNGDIDFITPTDIIDEIKYQKIVARTVCETEKMRILPIGAIVYTCIASIGKMAITMKPSITNQQINALIVNEEHLNEFVYYSLLKQTPKIKSTKANTTLPIINKTEFSKIKIALPSLSEQKKIANFLTSLDESIESLGKQIEATTTFKKGLLQQMFV